MSEDKKYFVIWLTGLPRSGKTTIAKEIEKKFKKNRLPVARLDGDVFRKENAKTLGFSKKDRDENIRRAAEYARQLAENRTNVVAAFVSPYREMRDYARKICPNFIEIYVKCSLDECMRRDKKGMYKKAIKGEIKNFTGVQDPYEEPKNPDLVLDTEKETLAENVEKVMDYLEKQKRS